MLYRSLNVLFVFDTNQVSDYYDLLQLTEEMLASREGNRTATVVTALVQHITR